MNEKTNDLVTIPNGLTLARLALSPLVARRLHNDSAGTWRQAGMFVMSDVADGFLARLGNKSKTMNKLGFRVSKFGKNFDPSADVLVTSQMIVAGMHNGVVPKWLGGAALAQKAVKSNHAVNAAKQGAEIEVGWLGKRSELLTNVATGSLFAAEQIENEQVRSNVRELVTIAAAVGIAGAWLADRQYVAEAERQLVEQ